MDTTIKQEMAMSAVGEICTRSRRGANTAHAVAFRSVQGRTVPVAGDDNGRGLLVADVRTAGIDVTAPFTGYPRLEAPPV